MNFDQSAISPSALTAGLLASQSNLIVVSSTDKMLSVSLDALSKTFMTSDNRGPFCLTKQLWDTDSYKLIASIRCDQYTGFDSPGKDSNNSLTGSSSSFRVFLNYENRYCICAGVDIRLYEVTIVNMMTLVDEFNRDNRDCSVKQMIQIKNDKIAVATNSDIEIYGLVRSSNQQPSMDMLGANNENTIRLRELKRLVNAHKETILSLDVVSSKFELQHLETL